MRIINHPIRRRIIEILALRPMSWKELSNELGVRTGSLYHHLDTLERIVTRDSDRRYTLTKLGYEINSQLSNEKNTPAQSMQGIEKAMKRRTVGGLVREVFVPRALIVPLTSTRLRAIASLVGMSGMAILLLVFSGDELLLFSFSPSTDMLFSSLTYFASLFGLAAIAYAALSIAFKERGDVMVLLASAALSFIPLLLFGASLHMLNTGDPAGSTPLSSLSDSSVVTVVFAFFQAWGAGVVGAGMSVASGLRVEKTLVVSLVILYASMLIIFMNGGRLA